MNMFSKLKNLKNYWFPSARYIAENFCKGNEIIFNRGYIIACDERKEHPWLNYERSMRFIMLGYMRYDFTFAEVAQFKDILGEKTFVYSAEKLPKNMRKAVDLIKEKLDLT